METKYSSKTSLFLMELIIAILFFAISSAICTQLFVKSHIISQHTVNDNHAVQWVQNISEVFYSQNGDFQLCKNFFSKDQSSSDYSSLTNLLSAYEDNMYLTFDKDWNIVQDISSVKYMVLALYSSDETFHYLDLCVFQIPTNLIMSSDSSSVANVSDIVSIETLTDQLSRQQNWQYSIQIKSYSGLKGGQHE